MAYPTDKSLPEDDPWPFAEWECLGWYRDDAHAQDDGERLSRSAVRFDLKTSSAFFQYPDGTRRAVKLTVNQSEYVGAVQALNRPASELEGIAPEGGSTGDEPILFKDEDGRVTRYVVASRYETAAEMLAMYRLLRRQGIRAIVPHVWRPGAAYASTDPRPDRFVLRVAEDQLDAARTAFAIDDMPQEEDEPRCPRCRSWRVDEPNSTGTLLAQLFKGRRMDELLQCNRCGHLDERSHFFRPPGVGQQLPFASSMDDEEYDRNMAELPITPDYQSNLPVQWVTLRKYLNEFEAKLVGNELEANGIEWQLLNQSMAGWTAEGVKIPIPLQVRRKDLDKARAVLANHAAADAGDMEPAEAEDPSKPLELNDDEGVPAVWQAVAVFESARALNEAAMVLESSHLSVLLPRLVPRGDRAPGEGPRFVLRVQADDIERAQSLLNRASEEREEDELRCPRCGSYSVHESKHEFANLLLGIVGQKKPAECECMKCHYKGAPAEFGA